jgi:hypothetical protein
MTPTPTVPGPDAEEDAAAKPRRPVVAVRRASIRIVRVVSPLTSRGTIDDRSGNDRGADSNPDHNPCMSSRQRHEGQCQNQRKQN